MTQRERPWVDFFQILTMHRVGYAAHIDPRIVAGFDDHHTNGMARRVYMVALPEGDPMGITPHAREWRDDGKEVAA